jgi:hypothetical protein
MIEQGWGQPPKQRTIRAGRWRGPALVLIVILSLAAGFWFGGEADRGISTAAIAALAVCVLLGDLLGSRARRWARLASAVTAALIFGAGWILGSVELERAFTTCVTHGEEVRTALEEHRERDGEYPVSLDELTRFAIPGGRLLRPGLMLYERTTDGYALSFADATVRMTATHERGFFERRVRSTGQDGRAS